jgi:hypothetical protein
MAWSRKPVTAPAKTAVSFITSKKGGKTSEKRGETPEKRGETSEKDGKTSGKGGKKTVVTADSHASPPRSKSPQALFVSKEAKRGTIGNCL